MGYYMAGDYYMRAGRGDLLGTLKSIGKGIIGGVGGLITGGVGGAISGIIQSQRPTSSAPIQIAPTNNYPQLPAGLTSKKDSLGVSFPGGGISRVSTTLTTAPTSYSSPSQQGGPRGFHLDKKTQSKWVKNRSMNPANPRALRRAVRREQSFVHLAKRVLRGTGITVGRHSFARKTTRKR